MLWSLEPGFYLVQGGQGVPGSGHSPGPRWVVQPHPRVCWGRRNARVRPQLWLQHGEPKAAWLLWDSLTIRAVLGALLPAEMQPLSGQRGLDVALPTLLVEAESGGYCGQRWPSP